MTDQSKTATVLVTGASGFIGSHCVLELLNAGYKVRGTLRDLDREGPLREALARHTDTESGLEFVRADLLSNEQWDRATGGCDYVLHVASPYPAEPPKHEDDLILPAREGTLRVLEAAARSGTRRVVLTSSIAAIYGGHEDNSRILDESDWTDLDREKRAYHKSKTLAEKAAWNFAAEHPETELVVINPGAVLGPSLDGQRYSTSGELVRLIMAREVPGAANLKFQIVDVRDVATAHLRAMTNESAAGRRYIAVSAGLWGREVAEILKNEFEGRGYKIPTRDIPDLVVRLLGLFNRTIGLAVPDLNRDIKMSTERISSELNWKGRDPGETIVATAESMIEHGIV